MSAANTPASPPLAGRGRRLLATLIDFVLVPSLTILLVAMTGATEDAQDYANLPGLGLHILGLAVLSYLVLNAYLLQKNGQTIGKKLLGIAIRNAPAADGTLARTPLWKLVCIRALFFPLLYLLPLWPLTLIAVADIAFIGARSRRCLHDLAAGTTVISLEANAA